MGGDKPDVLVEKQMEHKGTSIRAPQYFYEIARQDFGSVSEFFRIKMREHLEVHYGIQIKLDDIITRGEVQKILQFEEEQKTQNKKEMKGMIKRILNQEQEVARDDIILHKEYFEGIFQRANEGDHSFPYDYILKTYHLTQEQVQNLYSFWIQKGNINREDVECIIL
jgi:hypothetical protein